MLLPCGVSEPTAAELTAGTATPDVLPGTLGIWYAGICTMTLMMIATAITQLAVTIRPTCPFGVPAMRRRRAPNAAARAWIAEKTRLNFCINESLPPGCPIRRPKPAFSMKSVGTAAVVHTIRPAVPFVLDGTKTLREKRPVRSPTA